MSVTTRPVFFNIGLANSETLPCKLSEPERLGLAIGLLQDADKDGQVAVRLAASVTERTLCGSVFPDPTRFASDEQFEQFIFRLAQILGQEAIAIIIEDDGKLIGPMAEAWGEFDHSRFLSPFGDGS